MKLINLTRYPLNLYDVNGHVVRIEPSGQTLDFTEVADTRVEDFDGVGHITVAKVTQKVEGRVPDKQNGIGYIVPMRTLLAMQDEGYDVSDFYAPNMLVRDSQGTIIASRRLMQVINRD